MIFTSTRTPSPSTVVSSSKTPKSRSITVNGSFASHRLSSYTDSVCTVDTDFSEKTDPERFVSSQQSTRIRILTLRFVQTTFLESLAARDVAIPEHIDVSRSLALRVGTQGSL